MAQDTDFTLQCGYLELDLSTPAVMGILNLTPDSFYDGGQYENTEAAIMRAEQMIEEGATILDLGAVSSRPGSVAPDVEEEWNRLRPALEEIRGAFPSTVISIDTYRSEIAARAVDYGANIINDISGGMMDEKMYAVLAARQAAYVCMHMQGTPETMQQKPQYEDVVAEVKSYFMERISAMSRAGVTNIILDPGFGFGKEVHHNYALMRELPQFVNLSFPVLVGVSRKSMISKFLDVPKAMTLNGTTALNMAALMKGAKIIRVHDVKEAMQAVRIFAAV
ncbi:MAG: dihydropteroate synthase [Bacteroidia bacterium]|nr:dihydropteroate synthase [Bacteroidia bacterium]